MGLRALLRSLTLLWNSEVVITHLDSVENVKDGLELPGVTCPAKGCTVFAVIHQCLGSPRVPLKHVRHDCDGSHFVADRMLNSVIDIFQRTVRDVTDLLNSQVIRTEG